MQQPTLQTIKQRLSFEIANIKSPMLKYKKPNKPTIALIIVVFLTFGEIGNKGSVIDF